MNDGLISDDAYNQVRVYSQGWLFTRQWMLL